MSWIWKDNLVVWSTYVERAGTIDPMTVFKTMKADPNPMHSFGPGQWLGTEVVGIDNALVGNWPVGQIQDGKIVIVDMPDIAGWYYENIDLLVKHLEMAGMLWYQQ